MGSIGGRGETGGTGGGGNFAMLSFADGLSANLLFDCDDAGADGNMHRTRRIMSLCAKHTELFRVRIPKKKPDRALGLHTTMLYFILSPRDTRH